MKDEPALPCTLTEFGLPHGPQDRKAFAIMATVTPRTKKKRVPNVEVPPLEPGDKLSRAEFERRYDAMPNLKKAELIEGEVIMPSPVRFNRHGRPQFRLITWMGIYEGATPGVIGADNTSTRLDMKNEPQPDVVLLIDPTKGGQAKIAPDDYIEGAPELVGEVAPSSVSFDLHSKLEVYRRNGVREYLVWRVRDREIDWFELKRRKFVSLPIDKDGLLRSKVFPGLWLEPEALIRGDSATLHAVLQRGLASREHAAFVAKLNTKPKP
jgi:Uma2 family endonuclease